MRKARSSLQKAILLPRNKKMRQAVPQQKHRLIFIMDRRGRRSLQCYHADFTFVKTAIPPTEMASVTTGLVRRPFFRQSAICSAS